LGSGGKAPRIFDIGTRKSVSYESLLELVLYTVTLIDSFRCCGNSSLIQTQLTSLLAITSVYFGVIDLQLIRYSVFVRYWRKMGVLWNSTSVIYRFWKGLWLSQETSIVQYSQWIWYAYETRQFN